MNRSLCALIVFILSYAFFVIAPRRRMLVAVGAAFLLVLGRIITLSEAFYAVNWNVMGIFVGTLIVADIFMESRVPAYLAEWIVNRARSTGTAIVFICVLTGVISAFVENVATVLIVAPIALSLARKLNINPTQMMIALAVSSNLQGCATLIGDPPSMLLGGFARMNFGDFFFYQGRPSIFFAVELGALASFVVLYLFFRPLRQRVELPREEQVRSWVPTVILVALIVALAVASFCDAGFSSLAGIICMAAGAIAFVWQKVVYKGSLITRIRSLDWDTTLFLVGVFVLVGSLTLTGWIDRMAAGLSGIVGAHLLAGYVLLVLIAVVVSAFVDNVPFLAAMLPVAISMGKTLQINPTIFLFGLLIGASLGGNITPIGAAANIVACGILKKQGYTVSFRQFAQIGIPFTLVAVTAAGVFVWLFWGG